MIRGIYLTYNDDLKDIHAIRKAVFTDEMNIPAEIEQDEEDIMAMHALLYSDDIIVGTGRMRYDGETFIMDKVAVLKEHRRNGYADFLVRMLLDKVFMAQGKVILADVVKDTVPFFETIGFVVDGDEFQRDGLSYIPMKVEYGKVKTLCGGHCD